MGRVLEPEVMEGEAEVAAYDELDRLWGDVVFQGFAESALRLGVRRGRVLDVGTGSGHVAVRLAKLNPDLQIEAMDLSPRMLDRARQHASREGITNIQFFVGDAKRIPYEDRSFDLVISHQLLHQIPDPLVVLREINRVAKPQGAILVRDVRRLPEPAMSLAIPLWCLGYGAKMKEQTSASFRAGLTLSEFRRLVAEARIDRASVRVHWLTHQGIERPAMPFELPPPGVRLSHQRLIARALKAPYLSGFRAS